MIIEESELRVFDNTDLLVINSASWHAIRLQPILSGTSMTTHYCSFHIRISDIFFQIQRERA